MKEKSVTLIFRLFASNLTDYVRAFLLLLLLMPVACGHKNPVLFE